MDIRYAHSTNLARPQFLLSQLPHLSPLVYDDHATIRHSRKCLATVENQLWIASRVFGSEVDSWTLRMSATLPSKLGWVALTRVIKIVDVDGLDEGVGYILLASNLESEASAWPGKSRVPHDHLFMAVIVWETIFLAFELIDAVVSEAVMLTASLAGPSFDVRKYKLKRPSE